MFLIGSLGTFTSPTLTYLNYNTRSPNNSWMLLARDSYTCLLTSRLGSVTNQIRTEYRSQYEQRHLTFTMVAPIKFVKYYLSVRLIHFYNFYSDTIKSLGTIRQLWCTNYHHSDGYIIIHVLPYLRNCNLANFLKCTNLKLSLFRPIWLEMW